MKKEEMKRSNETNSNQLIMADRCYFCFVVFMLSLIFLQFVLNVCFFVIQIRLKKSYDSNQSKLDQQIAEVINQNRPIRNRWIQRVFSQKINSTSNPIECPTKIEQIHNEVNVSRVILPFYQIEKRVGKNVQIGGFYSPMNCESKTFVALIVCYRQRDKHLKMFLKHMHPFLQAQSVNYQIFVVNQHGKTLFNRGTLFNVGFLESLKLFSFNCFIFHDVDLFPEDLRNRYDCFDNPRHLSAAVDKFEYKLLYPTLFGGVTSFTKEDFLACNGYPNIYWGWGNEDDDMYLRVRRKLKKNISRLPLEISRYQMVRTNGHQSSPMNPHRNRLLHSKYNFDLDGLNTVQYQIHQIIFYPLFTLINVTLVEKTFEEILQQLHLSNRTIH